MVRKLRPTHLAPLGLAAVAVLTFPLIATRPATSTVPPRPASLAEVHRPLSVPDRIVLSWDGDPATSQAVTWRTDLSAGPTLAQIARADHGPKFVSAAATVQGESTTLETDLSPARYHSVRFTGLQPSTLYVYRVGDGVNWSEWLQFRTASNRPEPFRFLYFGDAQNDVKSLWSRVLRQAYLTAPDARFLIHAGDLINRANRDGEWGEWFGAAGWMNGMIPVVPTPGNHEYEAGSDQVRRLSRHWRPQFTLPQNGPRGLEETAYSLDYQGVRIVSLNSNEKQAEQVEWLEERLRDNPNRWTVLTFHHPLFSTARGRDNRRLRELWLPIIERYRVDLVLQGHDHTYGRSNLQTGVNIHAPDTGTVYVVSVSGPKMYNLDRQSWMERAAEDTQLYQVIEVDGGRLRYEARTPTGDVYDRFELRKTGGKNRLVERPARRLPERLRVVPPTPREALGGN